MPGRPCMNCRQPAERGRVCNACRDEHAEAVEAQKVVTLTTFRTPVGKNTIDQPIDATPFAVYVDHLAEQAEGGLNDVARRMGCNESWLRKGAWRRTGIIEREVAVDLLEKVDADVWAVYPDIFDVALEDDAYCQRCHENVTPIALTRVSEDVLREAHEAYWQDDLSIVATAERFFDRVPLTNVESFQQALSREWKRRGWPLRERTRKAA